MFWVINKEKVYSYMVTLSVIGVLFVMASIMPKNDAIQTSANSKELPVYSVKTEEKKVALTINCAWNADDIDVILKTLQDNNVQVTFFMVGDWVQKYKEDVKKISDANQEIGNHSLTHPHVNKLSYEDNVKQILECSKMIEEITNKKVTLYRAPYGEYNNTVVKAARENNHQIIQWSIDTLDYNSLTGTEMWKRIKDKLAPGSIVLMHNGTKHTAESLDMIIKNIKQEGYEIVPVSQLIYNDNYKIDANGQQIKL